VLVERLSVGRTLLDGYALFFIGAGLLGLPALILCLFLARATHATAETQRKGSPQRRGVTENI